MINSDGTITKLTYSVMPSMLYYLDKADVMFVSNNSRVWCTGIEQKTDGTGKYIAVEKTVNSNVKRLNLLDSQHDEIITNSTLDRNNVALNTIFTDSYAKITNNITSIPDNIDISNVTNANEMFRGLSRVAVAPNLDTSNVTNMSSMFRYSTALTTLPVYDTSKVTTMNMMLQSCPNLTDQSLDNLLQMCINVSSSYTVTKSLANVGLTSANYPASRIQALPHYSDFITAGWVIGYN